MYACIVHRQSASAKIPSIAVLIVPYVAASDRIFSYAKRLIAFLRNSIPLFNILLHIFDHLFRFHAYLSSMFARCSNNNWRDEHNLKKTPLSIQSIEEQVFQRVTCNHFPNDPLLFCSCLAPKRSFYQSSPPFCTVFAST